MEDVGLLEETVIEESDDAGVDVHSFLCSLKHYMWKTFPQLSQRLGAALYLNIELQALQVLVPVLVVLEEEDDGCLDI